LYCTFKRKSLHAYMLRYRSKQKIISIYAHRKQYSFDGVSEYAMRFQTSLLTVLLCSKETALLAIVKKLDLHLPLITTIVVDSISACIVLFYNHRWIVCSWCTNKDLYIVIQNGQFAISSTWLSLFTFFYIKMAVRCRLLLWYRNN
jgi:hypothetical protein